MLAAIRRLRLIEYLTAWLPFRFVEQRYTLGDHQIAIRTPKALHRIYDQMDSDDRQAASRSGVSEAAFPLIGIVWPAGEVLAGLMLKESTEGRRILEIGCGMALPSHLLACSGADITAMDIHPIVGEYLALNARLNRSPPIRFFEASWSDPDTRLGTFDLIIGSDLLYEPRHVRHLASFIDRHSAPETEVVICDPDRGQAASFRDEMAALGFTLTLQRVPDEVDYAVDVFRFSRGQMSSPG